VGGAVDASVLDDELGALFRGERLNDPGPVFAAVREAAPVYPFGSVIIVARFSDVRTVISDEAQYSNLFFIRGSLPAKIVAGFTPEGQRKWRELAEYDQDFMTRTEGEKHERLRKSAHRYFTPRQMGEVTGAIQEFVDALLVEAAEREVYDHKWLAGDLALRVMSHVIGCPQVDREYVRGLLETRGRYLGTDKEQSVHEAYAATKEFDVYVREVILAEHGREPGANPLLSALMSAEARLSTEEVVATLINIFIGGLETTVILMTAGLVDLMRHRDQWERLTADPGGLVSGTVEELLRFTCPAQWTQRIPKTDLVLHGVEIEAETTVLAMLGAANRDPRFYDDPDDLDISRTTPHLGLGFGPHFCLGASLIRHEARILFEALARRYPDLELAVDPYEVNWATATPPQRRVPHDLPVALGSA
jgi:cytochrome P450